MISPPSIPRTLQPKICRLFGSTSTFINPLDSSTSSARATQLIDMVPTSGVLGLDLLLDAGVGPGFVRFQLVFTGDAQTGEVLAVDRIELPWEPLFPEQVPAE